MPHIIKTISLLGLFAICSTAHADDCFCLVHADRAIVRGCESKDEVFLCTDPYTGKKSVQKKNSDWTRVKAGTDPCSRCRAQIDPLRGEGVRGGDAEKERR
jgi:hypothetical protein